MAALVVAENPSLELRLLRPPFWSQTFVSVLAGCAIGASVPLLRSAANGESPSWGWVHSLMLATFIAVTFAVRVATRPKSVPPIQTYPDHLLLPRRPWSKRTRAVRYEEILSLNVFGKGRRARLLIGTRERLIAYPVRALINSDAADQLRSEVHRLLVKCVDGPSLVAAVKRREELGRAAWNKKPVVTSVWLGAIAVCFAFEQYSGVLDQPFGLVRYGANASVLVWDGQLFRLAAATLLHGSLLHVYLNGIALFTLGMLVERLAGPWRFTIIFLAGAIGGSFASSLFAQAAFSVGASTAIFGLLGSLGVIHWRFRGELPGGFRQTTRWWVVILGLNGTLPVLVPQIDFAAHIGGFLAGAGATAVLCRTLRSIERQFAAVSGVKIAAVSLAALFSLGLAQAERYARTPHPHDEHRVARLFVTGGNINAIDLNNLAWQFAASPDTTADQLDIAKIAAERAIELEPDHSNLLDTLATVYYRLGRFDEAIATERRAVSAELEQFKASQVARFLAARMQANGPVQIGSATQIAAIRVEVELSSQSKEKRAFVLTTGTAYQDGAVIYALAKEQEQLRGVLRVVLGPNQGPQQHRLIPGENPFIDDWPDDIHFDVALVDTTACHDCGAETWKWNYWPIDADVRKLP